MTAVNHPNYKALETQGSWPSTLGLCLFKETVPSIGPKTPRYSVTGYCGIESINQGSQMGSHGYQVQWICLQGIFKDQYELRSRHSIIVPDNSVSFYFYLEICGLGFKSGSHYVAHCPGTRDIDHAGLCLPWMLALKACSTVPSFTLDIFKTSLL